MDDMLYLGVKGSVVGIERKNGREVWRAHLKGGGFVTVVVDEDVVFAHTGGELFCVDKKRGEVLWHNPLRGLGYGLAMIGIEGDKGSNAAMVQEMLAQQRQAGRSGGMGGGAM